VPGYAGKTAFARSGAEFAGMREWLAGPEAAGLDHGGLEEELTARGRELQRLLLQDYLDARAAREQRCAQVTGPDKVIRTRAERGHARSLATVFGPVTVSRIAYRAPGAPNVHPADAQLNLPPGRHSHGLARMAVAAVVGGSFGQACVQVRARTGSALGKRQCEQLIRAAAADFAGFYAARRPPGGGPGDVLALSCDGKGIVVLPSQLRPRTARAARQAVPRQDGRLSRGEVRNRKRMAEIGAVFDVTPVPRTAGQILDPGPRPKGPRAARKWITASVAADTATVVASVFAEAGRRDPLHQRPWIALADGNVHQLTRITAEARDRGITIAIICDFMHVLEYLWTAAWCFFPEASPQAGPWVRAQAAAVLHGRATSVAATIRARAATGALTAAQRKTAARTAGYLDAKAPYLDYPRALAAGWPITSGVIEGTCRYLVNDRMDITGARWTIATAEAVLQLRALHANGDLDAYWKHHLQQERRRTYHLAA
jgi:hypothetical protein